MLERRRFHRKAVDVFLNKFIGGHPYLCRVVDISASGIQVVGVNEPETPMESFSLELRLPGEPETFWLWARCVARRGRRQAFELVNVGEADRARLERFVNASQGARAERAPALGSA